MGRAAREGGRFSIRDRLGASQPAQVGQLLRTIARTGQKPAQMPQASQLLRRMTNCRRASMMAERGQTSSQTPQLMHRALIV